MSKDKLSNFSGENRPGSRSAAIAEAPTSSSSFFSKNSISGGTSENLLNDDILLNSSSRRNSTKEKSKYHMLSPENQTNPSPTERKSMDTEKKVSSELINEEKQEEKRTSANNEEKASKEMVQNNGKLPNQINPRLVHLDFIEKNDSNVQLVREVIINNTQIRNFTIKVLPKGGLSILLPNKTAKLLCEEILFKKLDGKVKRKGFLSNKKLFEVSCRVPKDLDPKNVLHEIKAEKFIKRGGNEIIFFMPSQITASYIVKNGKFVKPYHLEFAPFTFAPRIICKSCGSAEHFECTKVLCKSCGQEHKSEDCHSDFLNCYYCKGSHGFKDCPQFKEKVSSAKLSKKKSYAEALKNPGSTLDRRPKVALQSNRVLNSGSTEIIAVYCKVAGVPFKEHLLDQVIEEITKKPQEPQSVPDRVSSSPSTEPKKKSLKTTNKPNATAVIQAYERSNNPKPPVKSVSSASDMKGVEGNVEAFCKCGLLFKPNPGWKNHFYSPKCFRPHVTCPCKQFKLTLDNWSTTYGPFCQHLKKDCKGSS